jgi:hypothetical protein
MVGLNNGLRVSVFTFSTRQKCRGHELKGDKMQDKNEIAKINHFLTVVSPIVVEVIKTILQSLDWQVKQEGCGPDMVFAIKQDEKEAQFYLHNLFLEIATIDRDAQPLMFDENLRDFDYFLAKMGQLIASKLNVLFKMLGQENMDAAIESITKDAKQYERIRIWRFDNKSTSKK